MRLCACVCHRDGLELQAMARQLCHVYSVAQWKIMELGRDGDSP